MSSFAANHITGRYDFYFLPLQLPTPLVQALLPSGWPSPTPPESAPKTREGWSWVVVQAGWQIGTGPGIPGGKHHFEEAKLEIPYLRHPSSSPDSKTLVGFKTLMLFSSWMMTLAGKAFPGLRTTKASFVSSKGTKASYTAQDWLVVEEVEGEVGGEGWGEGEVKEELGSWWAGRGTGGTAFRHVMSSLTPPSARRLKLRLHLPPFAQLEQDELGSLAPDLKVDGDGWWEVEVDGWWLSEETRMEATAVKSL